MCVTQYVLLVGTTFVTSSAWNISLAIILERTCKKFNMVFTKSVSTFANNIFSLFV